MKKLLLTLASVIALTTNIKAEEDTFYVKAGFGWSKFAKASGLKSENSYGTSLAFGYNLADDIRMDLEWTHFIDARFKSKNEKVKTSLNMMLVNAYADVYELDAMKFFLGVGVGGANVRATHKDIKTSNSLKIKQRINIAYAGYAGASYQFTPGLVGELAYSYKDLGKTKKNKAIKQMSMRSHNISIGARLEL